MEQISLIEPQKMYADEIWKFRQEILECDAENEDQLAGCLSPDVIILCLSQIIRIST